MTNQLGLKVERPLQASYNIAPTHAAYVVPNTTPDKVQLMLWGLVPSWSKEGIPSGKLINARREGIQTKSSFRMPIRHRRCLVLADSFYEWRKEGKRKIPYRIFLKKNPLLVMAGIWDQWSDGNNTLRTFSVITTPPNLEMQTIHNRMPVILDTSKKQQRWLQDQDLNSILTQLKILQDKNLEMYRISERVNSPKYNEASLHEVVPEPPTLFS